MQVSSSASLSKNTFVQINSEVVRIKEISGNSVIINRAQFGTKAAEHFTGDKLSQVDAQDNALIEIGDEFGFTESRSCF